MVFSRFIWIVLAWVTLITATAVLLGLYLTRGSYPITTSLLILALVLETAILLYFLTRTRRDLLRLVHSLRNEDTSMLFAARNRDPYFRAIHEGFNEIIRDFRLVRIDHEARQRMFEATVDHVQFAMLAHNSKGEILLSNRALLRMLGMKNPGHMDEIHAAFPRLHSFLLALETGKESLFRLKTDSELLHLIVLSSSFTLLGEEVTLVSLRDISRALDQKELEAWQKLLRVLRHEVLNSLSPIQLIAGNLGERAELKAEEWEEVREGLQTIQRRAGGLSRFLDTYSSLYRTPEPELSDCDVSSLLKEVLSLHEEQARMAGIQMEIDSPKGLVFHMDQRLVEQVLINLVKNSLEALSSSKEGRVNLKARLGKNELLIEVRDNGPGIPADQMESIFIPFFSTREEGAGVGLSFSQHVMRMHRGRITVHSEAGQYSTFRLIFPA